MKNTFALTFILCLFYNMQAQVPVTLGLPPDARSSGMGDVGLATSPDASSQHWNVAKFAFVTAKGGASFSYTPWLRSLTDDMNLFYLSGYGVIGSQTLSASLRYFSMGEITPDNMGTAPQTSYSPNDWAVDIGYSRRFGERFSLGLAFRYISAAYQDRDNFTIASSGAVAADVGAYYYLPYYKHSWSVGLAFTNIGTKLGLGNGQEAFLPMNMGLGVQYALNLPHSSVLRAALDINKSLVPENDSDAGIAEAIIDSFGNSYGNVNVSGGLEYSYNNKLFVRGGYHYDKPDAGNRSHATLGAGVCFYNVNVDCSYLLATGGNSNALKNTVRFTLGYTF